jgi:O-antigen ligase
LFGVGTGDLKQAYQQAYDEMETKLLEKNRRRAHNQYLTFFISFGLIGFVLSVIALFGPAVYCRHKLNMLLLGFLFIMFASMLNEDTLENQAGVTLFIAFYSILIFSDNPRTEHG